MAVPVKLKDLVEELTLVFPPVSGGEPMNHPSGRGISWQGVDAVFAAEEARQSQLMLEAQLLRAQHQPEAAAEKFAEAASLEERLRDICLQKGLWEQAFVHGFSAASCWAQAGDFHHAIGLCHDVLAHPELPERLRPRVYAYVKALCARRAQWYADVVVQDESLG